MNLENFKKYLQVTWGLRLVWTYWQLSWAGIYNSWDQILGGWREFLAQSCLGLLDLQLRHITEFPHQKCLHVNLWLILFKYLKYNSEIGTMTPVSAPLRELSWVSWTSPPSPCVLSTPVMLWQPELSSTCETTLIFWYSID